MEMMTDRGKLKRFAWLSIATAVLTILLKAGAYLLTDSVGLLSDALESSVNLVAAVLALVVLTIASQPPDEEHAYGHAKAEYFSSGAEGIMIMAAALAIIVSAVGRLLQPQPLQQLGAGVIVSLAAAACNGAVAWVLWRAGREYDSITLRADARHLFTDVWTSLGVVVGIAAVSLTGWEWLDPVIALLVAGQIIFSGGRLLRESIQGLMDTALPPEELAQVEAVLEKYAAEDEIQYHALRTRQSGAHRFISVHVQVPGSWTVQKGHDLVEGMEREWREALGPASIITHLEPIEDPLSWQDVSLLRPAEEKTDDA
jgi:cation diffusion facilitator family transporter